MAIEDNNYVSRQTAQDIQEMKRRVLGRRETGPIFTPPIRTPRFPRASLQSIGQYRGQVHSMTTDTTDGWEYVQFVPPEA